MYWRSDIHYSPRQVGSWRKSFISIGYGRYPKSASHEIEKQRNNFHDGFIDKSHCWGRYLGGEADMNSRYPSLSFYSISILRWVDPLEFPRFGDQMCYMCFPWFPYFMHVPEKFMFSKKVSFYEWFSSYCCALSKSFLYDSWDEVWNMPYTFESDWCHGRKKAILTHNLMICHMNYVWLGVNTHFN